MVGKVDRAKPTLEFNVLPVTVIEIGFEPLVPCDNLPNDKVPKFVPFVVPTSIALASFILHLIVPVTPELETPNT